MWYVARERPAWQCKWPVFAYLTFVPSCANYSIWAIVHLNIRPSCTHTTSVCSDQLLKSLDTWPSWLDRTFLSVEGWMLSDIDQVNLPQYWLVNGKVEKILIRWTIKMAGQFCSIFPSEVNQMCICSSFGL